MDFHLRRRQQFLSEEYYVFLRKALEDTIELWAVSMPANCSSELSGRAAASEILAGANADLFLLKYTAGESLDTLRAELTGVVEGYEKAAGHARAYEQNEASSPLMFSDIEDYERAMQLIGLCYLFHRIDLLPRVTALFDGSYSGQDTLYEDLLSYELEDRYEVDGLIHRKPYQQLLNSLDRDSDQESIQDVKQFLKSWYLAMKDARWHDSHLNLTPQGAGYYGYWAIEAAAVAFLLELDDKAFHDHLVYPADLLEYARALDDQTPLIPQPSDNSRLRVPGGEACPQTGYWTTPAQQDSRRFFPAGQILPIFEHSAYGATIWQWSEEQ
jgi:hypothetical protein